MDPQRIKEEVGELLHSGSLGFFFTQALKPKLDEMKNSLLTNRELSDGDRRGYITARETILTGFSDIYEKYGIHLPKWLEQELN